VVQGACGDLCLTAARQLALFSRKAPRSTSGSSLRFEHDDCLKVLQRVLNRIVCPEVPQQRIDAEQR